MEFGQIISSVLLVIFGLFLIKSDRYNIYLSIMNLFFVIFLFVILHELKVNNIIIYPISFFYILLTKEYFMTAFLLVGLFSDVISIQKNKKQIQEDVYSVRVDNDILRDLYI